MCEAPGIELLVAASRGLGSAARRKSGGPRSRQRRFWHQEVNLYTGSCEVYGRLGCAPHSRNTLPTTFLDTRDKRKSDSTKSLREPRNDRERLPTQSKSSAPRSLIS